MSLSDRLVLESTIKHIEIMPVKGRTLWQAFHNLPHRLYAGDPNWVAPLSLERKFHFDPAHNPFFEHAKVGFWLAIRDGEPVGRITAQIDALHQARYHDDTGHFGFIEAIDDPAVFAALLAVAEGWLKTQGMRRSVGPVSFSMWDEPGLLVDGFDTPPSVLMGHALPYYQTHIASLGYNKAQDLIAYDYENGWPLPSAMAKIIDRSDRKHGIRYRYINMDKTHFEKEIALLLDIVNDAWSDNWGFVEMTKAEINDLAGVFKVLLPPNAVVIAEYQGEAVAFELWLPNLNEAIRDLRGRLFPAGFAKLLWRLKVAGVGSARMPMMGVRKKWQNSQIGATLALSMIQRARLDGLKHGLKRIELSWILESNERLRHMLALVGGNVYKRYRIYEKQIGTATHSVLFQNAICSQFANIGDAIRRE